MAVSRSPFSKTTASGQQQGYTFDSEGNPIYVRSDGTIMQLGGKGVGKTSKPKTTFRQEESALDRELKQSIGAAKINPALDAMQKINAAEDAQRIAAGGRAQETSSFGPLGTALKKVAMLPATAAMGALKAFDKVVSPIQQVGNAALHELYDGFAKVVGRETDKAGNKIEVSFDDFIRQARTKDFNVFGKGSGWDAGSGKMGAVLRFGSDTIFDPTTYMTLGVGAGASAASRATKFALANKFATKAMLQKYPQMAPRLSNVARYGASEIPAEIRAAEGIFSGVKFMGMEVPYSSGVAKAWRYSLAPVRAGIGDVVSKTKTGRYVLERTAPESIRGLVTSGFGRKAAQNTANSAFIRGLAEMSASDAAKGAEGYFLSVAQSEIANDIQLARDAGVTPEQMAKVVSAIEGQVDFATLDEPLQELAESYKTWRDNVYSRVVEQRSKLARDYDLAVSEMGFVEDHIFHTLTSEARDFMSSTNGKSYGFTGKDLTAKDLIVGNGTTSFRKYRAPVRDENGNIIQQYEFMGEKIQTGTIAEMNEIFRRKAGVDFDFFETDLGTIAQGYAESMSRAVGRVRYVDRAMQYGPEFIKPLIKDTVRDPQLVKELTEANAALIAQQAVLRKRVSRKTLQGRVGTGNVVAGELQSIDDLARGILDGRLMERELSDAEVAGTVKQLDALMQKLEDARAMSLRMTNEAKGEFDDLWQGLINETNAFREALVQGDGERFMALKALRSEFISMYGDDFPASALDDKSAEWFAEHILRNRGGLDVVSREQAILSKRRDYLRARLDDLPASEETIATRKAIETELNGIEDQMIGAQAVSERRMEASYADDGVIWGSVEMPGEDVPFQMFTTKPVDDETGTFFRMPDSIMGLAPSEEDLLDFRVADRMLSMLDEDSIATYFDNAWGELGIQDPMWRSVVQDAFATGRVDETFTQISPAKSALLQEILDFRTRIADNLTEEGELADLSLYEVESFFNWMRNINQHIVAEISPDNSDAVAGQVLNSIYAQITEDAAASGLRGALFPMQSLFPDLDSASGEWSVLFPKDMPAPMVGDSFADDWQMVVDNPLAESIYRGTQESYVLDLMNKGDKFKTQGLDIDLVDLTRRELEDELSKLNPDPTVEQLERLRATEKVSVNGKELPAKAVRQQVAKMDRFFESQYKRMDAEVKRVIESEFGTEAYNSALRMDLEDRLVYLMDNAAAIRNWDNGVGVRLQQEIDDVKTLLERRPAKGSTATSNAAWVRDVEKQLESLEVLNDLPEVRAATERVITLLRSDEVALAKIDDDLADNAFRLGEADAGRIGKEVVRAAERGWEELKGLGVQVPEEVAAKWGPNLRKLQDTEEAKAFWKGVDKFHQYWKKTVTASVGFFVRNGLSATFMNYADGVTNAHIAEGLRWAAAQAESRRGRAAGETFANWMDRAGITDPEEAQLVTEIVMAAGRGVSDDFAIPALGLTKRDGGIIKQGYNGYIGWFARKNNFVENAVRLPMAIDSVRKGLTFDEAVARIRRVHFDYSDLSKMDEYARRFIPFWIWTSRNLPLQVSQIAFRPKAYYEYERIKQENPVDPDLIVPKWIQDIGPLGAGANAVLTPDLPHTRLAKSLKDLTTVTGLLGQSTPLLKVPVETWIAKRQLGIDVGPFGEDKAVNGFVDQTLAKFLEASTGSWLTSRDKKSGQLLMDPRVIYTIEQFIPPLAQSFRLSGGKLGGKETLQERWLSSVLTWFGVPYREIGEQQMRSEVIRRRYALDDFQKMLEQIKLQGQ
jgi:hypothetical protein